MRGVGLTVAPDELFSAPIVGRDYLLSQGLKRCYPMIKESLTVDLTGLDLVEEKPQAVLIGDIGDELTYPKLNRAFRFLLDGAAFIALAQNRYFRGEDGLCLDVGSIVAGAGVCLAAAIDPCRQTRGRVLRHGRQGTRRARRFHWP